MTKQKTFSFKLTDKLEISDFYVNKTNQKAFDLINNINFKENIFLKGPNKSGKSHLSTIWLKQNLGITYKNNLEEIIDTNKNILIDNLFENLNEENLFHLINHCKSKNLKILITSNKDLYEYKFVIKDLISRLKTFHYAKIEYPDDDMLIHVITKLLNERQFIIKNKEIFDFLIKHANRTYENIYFLVSKMDQLSLEKKRQLTIPLIKEIM